MNKNEIESITGIYSFYQAWGIAYFVKGYYDKTFVIDHKTYRQEFKKRNILILNYLKKRIKNNNRAKELSNLQKQMDIDQHLIIQTLSQFPPTSQVFDIEAQVDRTYIKGSVMTFM